MAPTPVSKSENEHTDFPGKYDTAQMLVAAYLTYQPDRPAIGVKLKTHLCWQLRNNDLFKLTPEKWKSLGAALKIMGISQLTLSQNDLYKLSAEQWKAFDIAMDIADLHRVGLYDNYLSFLLPNAPPIENERYYNKEKHNVTSEFKAAALQAMEEVLLKNSNGRYYLRDRASKSQEFDWWCSDVNLVEHLKEKIKPRLQVVTETGSSKQPESKASSPKTFSPQESDPQEISSSTIKIGPGLNPSGPNMG
jgi:hypothetical protein